MNTGFSGGYQFAGLNALPVCIGSETEAEQAARYRAIRNSNHQHPDHDTAAWPAKDLT